MSSNDQSLAAEPTQPIDDEYQDVEKNYQTKSPKFWAIMVGVYLSIFLVALDRTIITTAIPKITDDFNSVQDIGWYGSAYMLTCASFNLIFGRIFQLYSTKWAFLVSIIIFEIGSAICGAAPNSTAFIVGRAIAGLGAAGIFSGGNNMVVVLVPLRKRPTFISIFGIAFGVTAVLGPIVGGAFTDNVTWRWCFYINLPIGGFTILATLLFVHIDSPKHERLKTLGKIKRLDPIGLLLFLPSMICLILALEWGGSTYSWSAPKMIGLLVTFAVLFIMFIIVEVFMPETAMAPMRIILQRSIAGSMMFMFLISGGLMSIIYYLTIWFQAVKGDSATNAGISLIPIALAMIIMGIVAAVFTEKVGYYVPPMLLAPVACASGAGLLSTISSSSDHGYWIGYQVLYGIGVGCGFQTSTLAAQHVLARADVPIGLALMFFMQQLGGSVFVAVSQNIFSTKLVNRLSGIAGLDIEKIVNTGATDLSSVVPFKELHVVVDAYNYAVTRICIMTAAISACMILGALVVEWKSIKTRKSTADPPKTVEDKAEGENDVKK